MVFDFILWIAMVQWCPVFSLYLSLIIIIIIITLSLSVTVFIGTLPRSAW